MSSDPDSKRFRSLTKSTKCPAKELGERLREIRKKKLKVSQEKILERLPEWAPSLDPSMISRIEAGSVLPGLLLLAALAVAYGLEPHQMIRVVMKDLKVLIDAVSSK